MCHWWQSRQSKHDNIKQNEKHEAIHIQYSRPSWKLLIGSTNDETEQHYLACEIHKKSKESLSPNVKYLFYHKGKENNKSSGVWILVRHDIVSNVESFDTTIQATLSDIIRLCIK